MRSSTHPNNQLTANAVVQNDSAPARITVVRPSRLMSRRSTTVAREPRAKARVDKMAHVTPIRVGCPQIERPRQQCLRRLSPASREVGLCVCREALRVPPPARGIQQAKMGNVTGSDSSCVGSNGYVPVPKPVSHKIAPRPHVAEKTRRGRPRESGSDQFQRIPDAQKLLGLGARIAPSVRPGFVSSRHLALEKTSGLTHSNVVAIRNQPSLLATTTCPRSQHPG